MLDIGCGGGLLGALVAAVSKPARFVGFDASRNAIAMAHANLSRFDTLADGVSRPEFLLLDVGAPWPEGTFDVVSIVDVVHHIPPAFQRSVLEQAVSALAPGGTFIYKDMTCRGVFRPFMNRVHDLALARQWIHYAPIEQVESWLMEAGLKLVRREAFNRLWYGHELLVFEKPASGAGS
jgi:SAM-dependent methyltransferase